MRKINRIIFLGSLIFTLGSCLKDPNITDDRLYGDAGIGKSVLIDIPQGTESSNFIDNTEGEKVVDLIEFRYSNENPAPEDIKIELEYDTDILADYTEEHETEHIIPPSNMYSLVNGMNVVIPKGQRSAYFQIKVKPADFLGGEYAFPVRIKSVSPGLTLNSLRDHVVMAFGTKNPWDGLYNYKTSATTSLQPNKNSNNVPLVTISATRVKTNLLNTYSNIAIYEINPATNKVTVVDVLSSSGAPNSIGTCITDPVSHYDPATKVMYVKWKAGTRSFEETYTYTGVR